jgi:hypothetical protein
MPSLKSAGASPLLASRRGSCQQVVAVVVLVVLLVAAVAIAVACRGHPTVGPSDNPDHGIVHVEVPSVTCSSFTVKFQSTTPLLEVWGTIWLTDAVAQTVRITYASPQTQHQLTFSNLERDKRYAYSIMGRTSFDHPAHAQIVVPFSTETASCCIRFPWE